MPHTPHTPRTPRVPSSPRTLGPVRIDAATLPDLIEPAMIAGRVAVVIDLLRASTTITRALDAGARSVVPCLGIEDAFALRRELLGAVPGSVPGSVLGGERGGTRIPGFDLANSPREYTPTAVRGRDVIFTTTNGTRAILAALGQDGRGAARVLIGCLNNLDATARALLDDGRDVLLVCAGTDARESSEDLIAAGAIAARTAQLAQRARPVAADGDVIARCLALHADAQRRGQVLALRESPGGRNLIALGLGDDVADCARADVSTTVGEARLGPIGPRRGVRIVALPTGSAPGG